MASLITLTKQKFTPLARIHQQKSMQCMSKVIKTAMTQGLYHGLNGLI
jgi:hypothetical protein